MNQLRNFSAAVALISCCSAAYAATPPVGTVSEASTTVMWTGAPSSSNPAACDPSSCDTFELTIVPPSYSPYKVIIEMDSTGPTPDQDDYDMQVFDPAGNQAGSSGSSGSNEKIALFNPPAGTYEVVVQAWATTAPLSSYAATAMLINAAEAPLRASPPPNERSIFATPTLMDSQLHTGEPSIDVSPVLPADGSRPLVIGDAPWGTSNATSLWWRSRDGAHTFELVQDPLAAPRPRPCEEIDGGGDSDTVIDRNGQIYVNDLAALINITVGNSGDDFQTMSCTKVDGTNPLQPIQDRQWIVASPFADGTGPNIDAYITFRRGLIGGNPLTETAIQIYATTDAGATYDPVGEITDFFGFSNNKVSQTGNPVVDPIDGTLYQAYYLGSVAKVGRYDPVANTFDALTVANRDSDVGNVFTTLAIDTDGNLYYGWIEGGSFDVHVAVSTDRGDTWSSPVRVNLPGDSDLAVNPYMVAGSPGRVAILYNATADAPSPDGADGQVWDLYLSQSLNALDPQPDYIQYKVTDTPLHFNAICTSGLGCNLSVPEGDRSLLEFNEVDIDESDGSMVFIFADNGRHAQAPVDPATEIPQPYIMSTRQIAGASMLAGKTINNTLPRMNQVTDPLGDATYPKAGTAEGPTHPALDLLASNLGATTDGVLVTLNVADLSNLNAALNPTYGVGDPRITQKALWVTRFEVVHETAGGTREEVYTAGMEFNLGDTSPTCFYGPVGVARNASGSIKRSNYSSADGTVVAGDCRLGNSIVIEVPYAAMGIDPALNPHPAFRSVVAFALAQPEAELDGMPVASYFNNQRTVDATRSYDWSPNDFDIDGISNSADNCPVTFNPSQADTDLDGIGDGCDNCSAISNADQCDTNSDGYGNLCDADLTNDGIVNTFDLAVMRTDFGNQGPGEDADLDCNEVVNTFDLAIMREQFGGQPGPSGLID
ncbi:MAG: exo-alpha-sialidase [Gammaproteobacteria bacterium]|nr:exo-alpha-sialidase [Gammaproteobacteria bacterium]